MIPDISKTITSKLNASAYVTLTGMTTIIISLTLVARDTISFYYLKQLYRFEMLTAYGFALSWIASFGSIFTLGMATGIGKLAENAFKSEYYDLLRKVVTRGFALMAFTCLVICLILFYSTYFLLPLFDIQEKSNKFCAYFILELMISMVAISFFQIIRFVCQCCGRMKFLIFLSILCLGSHFGFIHLFIHRFDFRESSVAFATGASSILILVLSYLYLKIGKVIPSSDMPRSMNTEDQERFSSYHSSNYVNFAKEVMANSDPMHLRLFILEVATVAIASLNNVEWLTAQIIISNFAQIIFAISKGIGVGAHKSVNISINDGIIAKAQSYAKISILLSIFQAILFIGLLSTQGNSIIDFYTKSETTKKLAQAALIAFLGGLIFENMSDVLCQCLKGVNEYKLVKEAITKSYYVIGTIMIVILSRVKYLEVRGVWIGIGVSYFLLFLMTAYKYYMVNWLVVASKLNYRLSIIEEYSKEDESLDSEVDVNQNCETPLLTNKDLQESWAGF